MAVVAAGATGLRAKPPCSDDDASVSLAPGATTGFFLRPRPRPRPLLSSLEMLGGALKVTASLEKLNCLLTSVRGWKSTSDAAMLLKATTKRNIQGTFHVSRSSLGHFLMR